jgi:hypothetical protein
MAVVVVGLLPRALAEGEGVLQPESSSGAVAVARAETDCMRAEEAGGGAVGWVVVGIVGPVWRPNMASMAGRSAGPRGVERKSAGRSDCVNGCRFSEGGREEGQGKTHL